MPRTVTLAYSSQWDLWIAGSHDKVLQGGNGAPRCIARTDPRLALFLSAPAFLTRHSRVSWRQPMGDLKMDNFDCAKEMGSEITFNSEGSHQR